MKIASETLGLGLAAVLALALSTATGCAGNYGAIRWDAGVGQSFAAAEVLPAHRYYTTGSDTAPDAILALREDRPLRGGLWREVAMTPATLARLVNRMQGTRSEAPYGRVVLDERGERIGAWYSYFTPAPVRMLDDGGVLVPPPVGTREDPFPPPAGGMR